MYCRNAILRERLAINHSPTLYGRCHKQWVVIPSKISSKDIMEKAILPLQKHSIFRWGIFVKKKSYRQKLVTTIEREEKTFCFVRADPLVSLALYVSHVWWYAKEKKIFCIRGTKAIGRLPQPASVESIVRRNREKRISNAFTTVFLVRRSAGEKDLNPLFLQKCPYKNKFLLRVPFVGRSNFG